MEKMSNNKDLAAKELTFRNLQALYFKMPQNDNYVIFRLKSGSFEQYGYEDHKGHKCLLSREITEYDTIYYFANSPEHQQIELNHLLQLTDNLFEVYNISLK